MQTDDLDDEDEDDIPDEWKDDGHLILGKPCIPVPPDNVSPEKKSQTGLIQIEDDPDESGFSNAGIWNEIIEEEDDLVEASIIESHFDKHPILISNLVPATADVVKDEYIFESFDSNTEAAENKSTESTMNFEEEYDSIVDVQQQNLSTTMASGDTVAAKTVPDPDISLIPGDSIDTLVYMDSLMVPGENHNTVSLDASSVSSHMAGISLQTENESMFIEDSLDPRPQFNIDNLDMEDSQAFVSNNNTPLPDEVDKKPSFDMNFSDNFVSLPLASGYQGSGEEEDDTSLASFIRKEAEVLEESSSLISETLEELGGMEESLVDSSIEPMNPQATQKEANPFSVLETVEISAPPEAELYEEPAASPQQSGDFKSIDPNQLDSISSSETVTEEHNDTLNTITGVKAPTEIEESEQIHSKSMETSVVLPNDQLIEHPNYIEPMTNENIMPNLENPTKVEKIKPEIPPRRSSLEKEDQSFNRKQNFDEKKLELEKAFIRSANFRDYTKEDKKMENTLEHENSSRDCSPSPRNSLQEVYNRSESSSKAESMPSRNNSRDVSLSPSPAPTEGISIPHRIESSRNSLSQQHMSLSLKNSMGESSITLKEKTRAEFDSSPNVEQTFKNDSRGGSVSPKGLPATNSRNLSPISISREKSLTPKEMLQNVSPKDIRKEAALMAQTSCKDLPIPPTDVSRETSLVTMPSSREVNASPSETSLELSLETSRLYRDDSIPPISLEPMKHSKEVSVSPQNTSSELSLEPMKHSQEVSASPRNTSSESSLEPMKNSKEIADSPGDKSSELSPESMRHTREVSHSPRDKSSEFSLEPQRSSREVSASPRDSTSELSLEPQRTFREASASPRDSSSELSQESQRKARETSEPRERSCSPNSSAIPVRDMAKIFESSFPLKPKSKNPKSSLISSSWKSMPNLLHSPFEKKEPHKVTSQVAISPPISASKISSAAIPQEEQEVCTLVPMKERKRIFEELERQGNRTRYNICLSFTKLCSHSSLLVDYFFGILKLTINLEYF